VLDHSVTSSERRIAREKASAALRAYAVQLRSAGATLEQVGVALGVSHTRAGQIIARAARLAARPRWHGQLATRALCWLRRERLAELPEAEAAAAVAKLTLQELRAVQNVGSGARDAIVDWLAQHGLTLRASATTEQSKTAGPSQGRPFDFSRQVASWRGDTRRMFDTSDHPLGQLKTAVSAHRRLADNPRRFRQRVGPPSGVGRIDHHLTHSLATAYFEIEAAKRVGVEFAPDGDGLIIALPTTAATALHALADDVAADRMLVGRLITVRTRGETAS
jgi:hypothetical protein